MPQNWVPRQVPVASDTSVTEVSLLSSPLNSPISSSDPQGRPAPISYQVPTFIQKLLELRGFSDPSMWSALFEPKLAELASPLGMKGMAVALDRLVLAHRRREKICLYGDFDLDGSSGLGLALDAFQQMGFVGVVPRQARRLSEGYGFHDFIVRELAADGVTLTVTIDVGITANAAALEAKGLGMDVIITDHHQPGDVLPDALAIVNPNQGDCPSGLGYLCGAGVIFYLIRGLKRRLADEGLISPETLNLRSLLDLYSIATLTDMVPLVKDNRVLVKHGLKVMQETQRPGLRALLKKLNLDNRELSAQDVAIRFAPKLNALSRLESGIRPIDIYTATDEEAAKELVSAALDQNSERLDLQSHGDRVARELLESWSFKGFKLIVSKEFHRGVVGLIATKIANDFGEPTFVGSLGENGMVVGSARTPQGQSGRVLAALKSAEDLLERFGGHPPAAGFEFHISKLSEIEIRINDYHAQGVEEPEVPVEYDLELNFQDLTPGFFRWLDALGPYGFDFPVPQFVFRDLILESVTPLRGGHQKWVLTEDSSGDKIDALYFSPPSSFEALPLGSKIALLGEVQKNNFRGQSKAQILIKAVRMEKVASATAGLPNAALKMQYDQKPY